MSEAHRILRDVHEGLESEGVASVEQIGDSVTFRVGLAAWVRWSFSFRRRNLGMVSGGSIEVVPGEPGRVTFEGSTRWFVILCTLGMLWLMLDVLRFSGPSSTLWFLPLGWLWVVGINFAIGRIAFRQFVASLVQLDSQRPGSGECPSCGTRYNPSDYRPDAIDKRCENCGALLDSPPGPSASA